MNSKENYLFNNIILKGCQKVPEVTKTHHKVPLKREDGGVIGFPRVAGFCNYCGVLGASLFFTLPGC